MLPPLMPVPSLVARSVSGGAGVLAAKLVGSGLLPSDLSSPGTLLEGLGLTPQALLNAINVSPLLLRMISDTMCTYSVIFAPNMRPVNWSK